ncbi:MAG: hypothetical protein IJW08_08180 [Lentisphaeria bacterium]|nr:hypothetical protein [Lentisphaeria bacterium]MBQ7396501.1 hypothetical protein [Lentisphaeria bacterium]MBR7119988.1 hypothetical protein [Lentisphaeria bacterium]
MIQHIPGYILIFCVGAFIFMVNSINLKKNRAIASRANMIGIKAAAEEENSGVSAGDVKQAVAKYNECAAIFNDSITSPFGSILNRMLKYPLFEIIEMDDSTN